MRRAIDALAQGSVNDQKSSARLSAAIAERSVAGRIRALTGFFCTQVGGLRAKLMTGTLSAGYPDVDAVLVKAQQRFAELCEHRRAHILIDASVALCESSRSCAPDEI